MLFFKRKQVIQKENNFNNKREVSISFPSTYCVIDIETSGLNTRYAEIIELSAIKVVNNRVVQEFSTLVKPRNLIDPASTSVNGITNKMVQNAPLIQTALKNFLQFIGNNLLLGYNITTFDLPIIRRVAHETLGIKLSYKYIDVLHIANDRLQFLPNRKLSTVAAYFTVDTTGSHRALSDCYITKACYEKLVSNAIPQPSSAPKAPHKYKTVNNAQTTALQALHSFLLGITADNILTSDEVYSLKKWMDNNAILSGQYPFDRVFSVINKSLEDGILEQHELDEMLLLFKRWTSPLDELVCNVAITNINGLSICLTGDFSYAPRPAIEELIKSSGGLYKSSVSGVTDYLVVGNLGSPDWSCGNYGGKIKKALELQDAGKKVQIINEESLIRVLTSSNN